MIVSCWARSSVVEKIYQTITTRSMVSTGLIKRKVAATQELSNCDILEQSIGRNPPYPPVVLQRQALNPAPDPPFTTDTSIAGPRKVDLVFSWAVTKVNMLQK
jgi:hypothetical protein